MPNYEKKLNWIDEDMTFDKWYNVKSDEQVEAIKDLMRAGFLPDCIFNDDYSKFKKSRADYEEYLINKILCNANKHF